jgi:hypothetical protein
MNYFPYQPQQYPIYNPVLQPQSPAPTAQNDINFVNGIDEASAWVVQPGRSAFLMDRNASVFYVKSVDVNGMPNPLEIYDYVKRGKKEEKKAPDVEYVTRDEFEKRLAELKPKRPTRKKEADDESDVQ